MSSSRQQERNKIESEREKLSNEKEKMSSEDVATYGQVQERKKGLISVIDSNLS
jgi:hypothetical protein